MKFILFLLAIVHCVFCGVTTSLSANEFTTTTTIGSNNVEMKLTLGSPWVEGLKVIHSGVFTNESKLRFEGLVFEFPASSAGYIQGVSTVLNINNVADGWNLAGGWTTFTQSGNSYYTAHGTGKAAFNGTVDTSVNTLVQATNIYLSELEYQSQRVSSTSMLAAQYEVVGVCKVNMVNTQTSANLQSCLADLGLGSVITVLNNQGQPINAFVSSYAVTQTSPDFKANMWLTFNYTANLDFYNIPHTLIPNQLSTTGSTPPVTTGVQVPATTGIAVPSTTGMAQPSTTGALNYHVCSSNSSWTAQQMVSCIEDYLYSCGCL